MTQKEVDQVVQQFDELENSDDLLCTLPCAECVNCLLCITEKEKVFFSA